MEVKVTDATAGPDEDVNDGNYGSVAVKDRTTGDTIYRVTTLNRQISKVKIE